MNGSMDQLRADYQTLVSRAEKHLFNVASASLMGRMITGDMVQLAELLAKEHEVTKALVTGFQTYIRALEAARPERTLQDDYAIRDLAITNRQLTEAERQVNDGAAKIVHALSLAKRATDIDGAHHKQWLIDQMVRALATAAHYQMFRDQNTDWDEGIAP